VTAYIIPGITREFRPAKRPSRFAAPGVKEFDVYREGWRGEMRTREGKEGRRGGLGGGRAWMAKSERNAESKKEEFPGNMDNHATWELLPQICVVSESEYVGNRSFLQGYGRPQYSSNMKKPIEDLEKHASRQLPPPVGIAPSPSSRDNPESLQKPLDRA
jgi:hypothetical protein